MSEQAIDRRRELAIKRIRDRNGFWTDAFSYFVVNGLCVLVWFMTGAGFFWPVFLIALWGLGLVMHGYNTFFAGFYTERQVQREMERLPKDATEL